MQELFPGFYWMSFAVTLVVLAAAAVIRVRWPKAGPFSKFLQVLVLVPLIVLLCVQMIVNGYRNNGEWGVLASPGLIVLSIMLFFAIMACHPRTRAWIRNLMTERTSDAQDVDQS